MSLWLRERFLWLCLGFFVSPALAETQMESMLVSVNVMPGCVITASPLVFGFYSPYAATSTKGIAKLKVLCTLSTPYNIALDQGNGRLATTRLRTLSGPDKRIIRYILAQNPTYTINWGNTTGIDTATGVGSGVPQYLTVYGVIPEKQNVGMGAYKDVVNVSIMF